MFHLFIFFYIYAIISTIERVIIVTLGERIKEIRDILGFTQQELAEAVGVSRVSIGNYERNVRVPDSYILKQIANVLSTTTDYLLGNVSSPKIDEWSVGDVWDKFSVIKDKIDYELSEYLERKGYCISPSIFDYSKEGMTEDKYIALMEQWKKPSNQYYIFTKNKNVFYAPPQAVIDFQQNILKAIEFEWFKLSSKYSDYKPPTL